MDAPAAPQVDFWRLLRRVALNRWRLILVVFLVVAVPIAVWALVLVPKTYEAVATIFLDDPKKVGPGLVRDLVPPSDAAFQIALLRSRSLAEAVVENLSRQAMEELYERNMYRDYLLEAQNGMRRLLGQQLIVYGPRERVLAELRRARARFVPLPSGEVEIRSAAYHPRVAMELANTYVDVLQARSRTFARDEARATREFIENFMNQTKAALQESEEALKKAQRGRATISLPQRSALELNKLAQIENTLADIQASKEIAKVRLNFLGGGKEAPTGAQPLAARLALQQLRERLAQLEDKLATLLEKYTEQHPLVAATRTEIKEVRGNLAAALQATQDRRPDVAVRLGPAERAALSKQMADLGAEVSGLEAKEEVLNRQIARLSRNLSTLSAEEMENIQLVRKVEAQRNLYTSLSDRLGTARIQEQAEGRGLRIIDLAALPSTPTSSPITKTILLGVVLGLGLGVGVAGLLEYLNQPIETEEEATRVTGLPVLGWLPQVEPDRSGGRRPGDPLNFLEDRTPLPLPAEGCRSIRTALESLSRHHNLRTIMLTSPGPREGKSTVLLNLGFVFRELGRRLIVVDSDLRRPALHRALRVPAGSGLVDLLGDAVRPDEAGQPIKEDFYLLPAGRIRSANPGALMSAEKLKRVLDLLKDRADLVLFDSPPVLAVSDNLILASMVDGVILVVQAGRTQRRDLLRAKEHLEKVGAPLLGIVLNQVSPSDSRRYYARYADYYPPGSQPSGRRSPWDPRGWWARRRRTRNGRGKN